MPFKPETYISVDVEASGSIPGEFSLLSIGACVVGKSDQTFYAELKPINNNFLPRAMMVNRLSLDTLKAHGLEPAQAMAAFTAWINKVAADTQPVFVGFNAAFDWSFVNWYFIKFLGRNPLGIAGLDIKSYFMGKHHCSWRETLKRKVRQIYPNQTQHTHNALDDAKEQAEIFAQML